MDEPFWQSSPSLWDAARVREFLDEKVREGDHLEYKGVRARQGSDKWQVSDDLLETICGMANTADGLIFVGVRADERGYPVEITGLPHPKPEKAVRDRCAIDIEPGAYIDTWLVENVDPDKDVLLIRVRRGGNPPYVLRDKGVYVRNDEHDRPARRADLDAFYARRSVEHGEISSPWAMVTNDISSWGGALPHVPEPIIMLGLSPAFPATDTVLGRQQDERFRMLCGTLIGLDTQPVLEPGSVSMWPEDEVQVQYGLPRSQAWADGTIVAKRFFAGADYGESEEKRVGVVALWKDLRRMMTAAEMWSREVCGVGGTLLYWIALGNIADAVLVLPGAEAFGYMTALERIPPGHRNKRPKWLARGEWEPGQDPNDIIERDFVTLARLLQCNWWESMQFHVREWASP